MRRASLCLTLSLLLWAGFSGRCEAQIPVTDVGSHILQQLGIANQVTELGKWVELANIDERDVVHAGRPLMKGYRDT